VGILLGAVIPPAWALDFALPLTFIALVMPLLDNRASQVAALVAGSVILLTNSLPYKIGLILAVLIGIAAGLGVERRA
jgi:predicted branched-subunit amino acid permease